MHVSAWQAARTKGFEFSLAFTVQNALGDHRTRGVVGAKKEDVINAVHLLPSLAHGRRATGRFSGLPAIRTCSALSLASP
jgi:hypothetical protein